MRHALICLAVPSLFAAAAQAAPPHHLTQTLVLQGRTGRHSFVLTQAIGPFRVHFHHVRFTKAGGSVWPLIDGKYEFVGRFFKDGGSSENGKNWYGTDGGLPTTEFYRFDLKVDGRKWPVPSWLYDNCYDTGCSNDSGTQFQLADDGLWLKVTTSGSDGAGAYNVTWIFRKSGRDGRSIEDAD